MARKLASIVTIATCDPIPDTDRLSVATMVGKGWKVVTGRDEYKPGDKAIYFEIDSYLPADDSRYEFLKERCLRKFVSKSGQVLKEGIKIKTVKLRGVISQGLLMPLSLFPEVTDDIIWVESQGKDLFIVKNDEGEAVEEVDLDGVDVTSKLKVEHYDEIAEALRPATSGNPVAADAMGKFPSDFIPKTDEERIQNLGDYFTSKKGVKFEVTEKNDGSSLTMFLSSTVDSENPFGVCSRNLRLKPETEKGVPIPWQMAKKYDMENKLAQANQKLSTELAFQGELVGPGINCNRDMYTDFEWHVFRIWDIKNQLFLIPSVARDVCADLDIPYVPVIDEHMDVFNKFSNVDELLKFAEGKTARGHEREGLVFKSTWLPYVSFKVVSNKYLLKGND